MTTLSQTLLTRLVNDPRGCAERDATLVTVGFKPTLERVTKVYGEGYEAVTPVIPAKAGIQPDTAAEFADEERENDTPANQATRLSADTATAMADLIGDVAKMVESAASIEALQTDLVNAYGHLDTDELTRVMALAFAASDLAGMLEARDA